MNIQIETHLNEAKSSKAETQLLSDRPAPEGGLSLVIVGSSNGVGGLKI